MGPEIGRMPPYFRVSGSIRARAWGLNFVSKYGGLNLSASGSMKPGSMGKAILPTVFLIGPVLRVRARGTPQIVTENPILDKTRLVS